MDIYNSIRAETLSKKNHLDHVVAMANNWDDSDITRFKGDEKAKARKIQKIAQTMTAYEFSKYRLTYTQTFSEVGVYKKPEMLWDKFIFLQESLKIVNHQLVREVDYRDFLKERMHDIILEKVTLIQCFITKRS